MDETPMCGLQIRKGGRLISTDWICNAEFQPGQYVESDVTAKAITYLFESCTLEDGLILRDIFLLLNTNLDMFDIILGNWCKEYVQEGLKDFTGEPEQEIEYLDLYSYFEKSKDKDLVKNWSVFPELHGTGFIQKEDKYMAPPNEDLLECEAGKRISYAVEFMPANELAQLPIKLSDELKIYDIDKGWEESDKLKGISYSLGQILYAILWEISFCGGPEDRNDKKDELHRDIEEIKTDLSKLGEI